MEPKDSTQIDDGRRWRKWVKLCRRYRHLGQHGKNRRIRNKNINRLMDTYYKGDKAIKL